METNPVCGHYGCNIEHAHIFRQVQEGTYRFGERKVCRNSLVDLVDREWEDEDADD